MLFEFLWFMLIIICICILIPGPGSCGLHIVIWGKRNTEAILGASNVVFLFCWVVYL